MPSVNDLLALAKGNQLDENYQILILLYIKTNRNQIFYNLLHEAIDKIKKIKKGREKKGVI